MGRKNNVAEMTIYEQIDRIRNQVCSYACKYMDHAEIEAMKYVDDFEKRCEIQGELYEKCEDCPFKLLGEA